MSKFKAGDRFTWIDQSSMIKYGELGVVLHYEHNRPFVQLDYGNSGTCSEDQIKLITTEWDN